MEKGNGIFETEQTPDLLIQTKATLNKQTTGNGNQGQNPCQSLVSVGDISVKANYESEAASKPGNETIQCQLSQSVHRRRDNLLGHGIFIPADIGSDRQS